MIAKIDADNCIGCELCVNTCPEVFKMEENKATVIADPVPESAENSCQEAADNCPVDVITVQ